MECPERLTASWAALEAADLITGCHRVPCRMASDAELLAVHSAAHLHAVAAISTLPTQKAVDLACEERYESVYLNAESLHCARLAAGGTVALVERVLKGELDNGMALVRPPGTCLS